MYIVASALLLALAVAAYVRDIRARGVWPLLAIRVLVVLMLAMLLLDAVVSRSWVRRPARVVMLVDRSRSMSSGGADTLALSAVDSFPLPEGVSVEYWLFGDSAVRAGTAGDTFGAPSRTRTGEALERVLRTKPGAVVLVSDGRDNGDVDPVALAAESEAPVYTVGCLGSGERNVAAVSISAPEPVYAGDTFGVTCRIRHQGMDGEMVTVRLGGGTKTFKVQGEGSEQELYFRLRLERPGMRLVRLSVDSVAGESDYHDNTIEAAVYIRSSRLAVAYLTNRPGPGTRFLTRALAGDRRAELRSYLAVAPGVPVDTEQLREADVLVLDNVSETAGLPWGTVANMVENGTGLLLLAGPGFRAGTELTRLLPGSGTGTDAGVFVPAVTPAARVFDWSDIGFTEVPPFVGAIRFETSEAADVWLESTVESTPLVLSYRVGKGRVVLVAGYPLWRWAFHAGLETVAETPLETFLRETVRFLAAAETERFSLLADRELFLDGDEAGLTFQARTPSGSGWSGLDVTLAVDSLPVPFIEAGGGRYRLQLDRLGAGEHRLEAEARLGDSLVGTAGVDVAVTAVDVESSVSGVRPGLLEAIARHSEGEYFTCDRLPGAGFEMKLAEYRREFRLDPRRTPWFYAVIALLVGLELFFRRRRGLL